MLSVSRLNDRIEGMTAGEHSGHTVPHGSIPITGFISGNCSENVFVNGIQVAFVGSITEEHDECCGVSYGVVSGGSSTVLVNNNMVSRIGDFIDSHSGSSKITTGSLNVFAGG